MIAKKRYTKKQITEAIKYWSGVLARIDESKSKFLDACSKEFGEAVVFDDKDMLFEMSSDNLKVLFQVLDQFMFNSKLKTLSNLKLFVGNPSQLNSIILQYTKGQPVDLNNYFALYQPDYDIQKNQSNSLYKVVLNKDAIFINTDSHKTSTFSYAASNLCHEMIHVYDMYFGKLYNYLVWALNKHAPVWAIDQNSHLTSTFKEKKMEFKTMTNIEIQDNGHDYSFDEFNEIASKDIGLMREDDGTFSSHKCKPFSRQTIDFYKDSKLVQISDDGMSFSFSFGIPLPKK